MQIKAIETIRYSLLNNKTTLFCFMLSRYAFMCSAAKHLCAQPLRTKMLSGCAL